MEECCMEIRIKMQLDGQPVTNYTACVYYKGIKEISFTSDNISSLMEQVRCYIFEKSGYSVDIESGIQNSKN